MLLDLDWRGEGAIEISEMRKHEVVTIREMSSLFCSNKLTPSAAQIIIAWFGRTSWELEVKVSRVDGEFTTDGSSRKGKMRETFQKKGVRMKFVTKSSKQVPSVVPGCSGVRACT